MEELWQRFSGWAVAGFFAISTTFLELLRRQAINEITDLKDSDTAMQKRMEKNKDVLSDHETRLQLSAQNADRVNSDLADIKTSISNVHSRMDESSAAFMDKLDRILERQR